MAIDTKANSQMSDDQWEQDLRRRYPEAGASAASAGPGPQEAADNLQEQDEFRNYEEDTRSGVREFYRLNHRHQTVDFVRSMHDRYLPLRTRQMSLWDAFDLLDDLVDDSDPDTEHAQTAHAIQTAEAIRANGHPDWFILTGLIHDLGKVLCLFGEPQWAVTGDTFPVGCAWSTRIVLPEFFADNPDSDIAEYQTACGIYAEGCGLNQILMSWGHDEYLYRVVGSYLPIEAQYMIRYHSFYAAHREGEYQHLMNEKDRDMFSWVQAFNPYDLYTKHDDRPDPAQLIPFYKTLAAKYFPDQLQW